MYSAQYQGEAHAGMPAGIEVPRESPARLPSMSCCLFAAEGNELELEVHCSKTIRTIIDDLGETGLWRARNVPASSDGRSAGGSYGDAGALARGRLVAQAEQQGRSGGAVARSIIDT